MMASLFFSVAVVYSLTIPIFEASDETLHYPYVKQLADGKGLPVAGRDRLLKQEATQAPFFYAIAALATFWLDTDNMEDLLDFNPHWAATMVRPLNDNQNRIVHGPADQFPYIGAARAIHLSRVVSILFGSLAVGCTVLIANELFRERAWLGWGAGAIAALNPQFIRTSATVSNDAASTAMIALLVWLSLRWRGANLTPRQIICLGILVGLSFLTKLNAIIGLGLVWLIFILWKPAAISWQQRLTQMISLSLIALLVAGWWFARNIYLYGEWAATDIHLELAGRGHLSFQKIIKLWPEIERSFWAAFGWGQIRVADWVYEWLRYGRYIALAGLAVYLIKYRSKTELKQVAFLAIWLLVSLILLFRWVSMVGSVSHARLLFPALPPIAILSMLGLGQWLPANGHWRLVAAFGLVGSLFIFAVTSLTHYVIPAFTAPGAIQASDIPDHLPRFNLMYGDGFRLVSAQGPAHPLKQSETFVLDVFWEGIAPLDQNYSVFIRLFDHNRTVITGRDTYPGLGLLPTKHWPPGKLVKDSYPLTIPSDFDDLPLIADIAVGLYNFHAEGRPSLATLNEDGFETDPLVVQVKLIPNTWPTATSTHPLMVKFEDHIQLTGYDWHCQDTCRLDLYWRPDGTPSKSYTVFIHHWQLGEQINGYDSLPRDGRYPTNYWASDEVILDTHRLPKLTEGELQIGLYQLESGARLPILTADAPTREQGFLIALGHWKSQE